MADSTLKTNLPTLRLVLDHAVKLGLLSTNPARTGSGAGSRRRPSRWRRSPPPSFGASSRPLAPFVCRAASAAAVAARRRIPTRCVRCRCCIRRPRIGPSGTHRTPGMRPGACSMGSRFHRPGARRRVAPMADQRHAARPDLEEGTEGGRLGNRLAPPARRACRSYLVIFSASRISASSLGVTFTP